MEDCKFLIEAVEDVIGITGIILWKLVSQILSEHCEISVADGYSWNMYSAAVFAVQSASICKILFGSKEDLQIFFNSTVLRKYDVIDPLATSCTIWNTIFDGHWY